MTYRVKQATRVETGDSAGGLITRSFKAGDVKPRSEQEEALLELLVLTGSAERVEEKESDGNG